MVYSGLQRTQHKRKRTASRGSPASPDDQSSPHDMDNTGRTARVSVPSSVPVEAVEAAGAVTDDAAVWGQRTPQGERRSDPDSEVDGGNSSSLRNAVRGIRSTTQKAKRQLRAVESSTALSTPASRSQPIEVLRELSTAIQGLASALSRANAVPQASYSEDPVDEAALQRGATLVHFLLQVMADSSFPDSPSMQALFVDAMEALQQGDATAMSAAEDVRERYNRPGLSCESDLRVLTAVVELLRRRRRVGEGSAGAFG